MDEPTDLTDDEPDFIEALIVDLGPEAVGMRLDKALASAAPELSRARIQALMAEGRITYLNEVITDASAKARAGFYLIAVPEPLPAEPQAEAIPLTVLYEDADLIVIDKPAGMTVHPAPGNQTGTLVNALLHHCGDSLSGIGGVRRPGIVHRLDKDTSGLLVVAKTDRAHAALTAQFADHGRSGPLERAYVALAWGTPARTSFTIDAPLDRDTKARDRIAVRASGRHAITHVTVEESLAEGLVSRITCRLETGRTHQIRVHMAHAGHPLLGDETYGKGFRTKSGKLDDRARGALDALGRQALHAAVLGFAHPATGQTMRFESPLPADMASLLDALRGE